MATLGYLFAWVIGPLVVTVRPFEDVFAYAREVFGRWWDIAWRLDPPTVRIDGWFAPDVGPVQRTRARSFTARLLERIDLTPAGCGLRLAM